MQCNGEADKGTLQRRIFPPRFSAMLYQKLLLTNLETIFDRAAKVTGTAKSSVQRKYALDSVYLQRLQQGASVSALQYDRIICRIARDWPAKAKWPRGVSRPTPIEIDGVLGGAQQGVQNG